MMQLLKKEKLHIHVNVIRIVRVCSKWSCYLYFLCIKQCTSHFHFYILIFPVCFVKFVYTCCLQCSELIDIR